MTNSHILVTGAAGFIGQRLCQRLRQDGGPTVAAMRRASTPSPVHDDSSVGLHWVQADLLNRDEADRAIHGVTHVVHLAHGHRGPEMTRNLVQAALKARVQRFVHISTMSVHGPDPGPEAAHEATALIGRYGNDYCDSKAEQEEIVQAAVSQQGLAAVILRPTVVYGPGSHFVQQVLAQAKSGVVTRFDGGSGVCNAVYIDDVCRAIERALVSDRAVGEAMFVNADEPVSWGDFIGRFASFVQPPPRIEDLSSLEARAWWRAHPPAPPSTLPVRLLRRAAGVLGWGRNDHGSPPWPPLGRVQRESVRVHFSNQKARRLMEWSPTVGFEEGVALTQAWWQAEGAKE